jgi:hypothetical protein
MQADRILYGDTSCVYVQIFYEVLVCVNITNMVIEFHV